MAKPATVRPSHRCSECGLTVAKWVGRCPECQAWGSISEVALGPAPVRASPGAVSAPARRIAEVDVEAAPGPADRRRRARPGARRRPGAGRGRPAGRRAGRRQVARCCCRWPPRAAREGAPTLYVTGEESAAQVRLRAGRTDALDPHLWLAAETDLGAVLSHVDAVQPGLLVVDSVQTIASSAVDGGAGGVTQVRAVTAALIAVAKERGIATVLVGHVTKDGAIAGPRLLEHLVDVVLHFEGDRHSTLRMVRAVKNRFGPADEVGCFLLGDGGIEGLADPSGLFLTRRPDPVPGTCVTVTVEGRRPMPAEVQALVDRSQLANPRRAVSGLDSSRVAMVLAVLSSAGPGPARRPRRLHGDLGGVRLTEPAADLAVALAVASARTEEPLPADVVAIGEVGLSGDVRPVGGVGRRLAEAAPARLHAGPWCPSALPGRCPTACRWWRWPTWSARSTPYAGCPRSLPRPCAPSPPPVADRDRSVTDRAPVPGRPLPRLPLAEVRRSGRAVDGRAAAQRARLRRSRHAPARRARARPARQHRRPDRARPRPQRRAAVHRRLRPRRRVLCDPRARAVQDGRRAGHHQRPAADRPRGGAVRARLLHRDRARRAPGTGRRSGSRSRPGSR